MNCISYLYHQGAAAGDVSLDTGQEAQIFWQHIGYSGYIILSTVCDDGKSAQTDVCLIVIDGLQKDKAVLYIQFLQSWAPGSHPIATNIIITQRTVKRRF